MELNINSPAYYTQQYGVDDDIYRMCKCLSEFVRDKKYSEVIDIIGITPIVAPKSLIEEGRWKEHKKCEPKSGLAFVSLQLEYEEYVRSDITGKKALMLDNILKSVKAVAKQGKIDYCLFEKDMGVFQKIYGILD